MRQTHLHLTPLLCLLLLLAACSPEPKRIPSTLPDVHGYITNIKRTANNGDGTKAVVAIKSMEGLEANYGDASVRVDKYTLIEDEDGEELSQDDLKEGHEVQIWFEDGKLGPEPVQGYAKAVRIRY